MRRSKEFLQAEQHIRNTMHTFMKNAGFPNADYQEVGLQYCRSMIMSYWLRTTAQEPAEWTRMGHKRQQLDKALVTCGLPPLPYH